MTRDGTWINRHRGAAERSSTKKKKGESAEKNTEVQWEKGEKTKDSAERCSVEKVVKNKGHSGPERHKSLHWTSLISFFPFLASPLQWHNKPAATLSGFQIKGNRSVGQNNLAAALGALEVSAGDIFHCRCCRLPPFSSSQQLSWCQTSWYCCSWTTKESGLFWKECKLYNWAMSWMMTD